MSDIIDTIDGALADWETSDDAMRWTADESVLEAAPLDEGELTREQVEAILAAMGQTSRALGKWAEDMRVAMTKFGAQVAELGRKNPELRALLEPPPTPTALDRPTRPRP